MVIYDWCFWTFVWWRILLSPGLTKNKSDVVTVDHHDESQQYYYIINTVRLDIKLDSLECFWNSPHPLSIQQRPWMLSIDKMSVDIRPLDLCEWFFRRKTGNSIIFTFLRHFVAIIRRIRQVRAFEKQTERRLLIAITGFGRFLLRELIPIQQHIVDGSHKKRIYFSRMERSIQLIYGCSGRGARVHNLIQWVGAPPPSN